MSLEFFANVEPIPYEGPTSTNPLAYRWYDADRVVRGRPMRDHLRIAVAWWHAFCGTGTDMFGAPTYPRPWHEAADPMTRCEQSAQAAFEFIEKLGVPFFCFHDRDVAPEGSNIRESYANLDHMAEVMAGHMERTGVGLLWGTANLVHHPRYMAGAATNPDPEIFAYAAAQVRKCLEVTHQLGGQTYILWGGREGYETLLNTDLRRESDQLGRFMAMVAEHKHRIGFSGPLCIEPKPQEPSKHQYDYDTATVYAFLQRYDLLEDFKVNIEVNHATLAGHSFEHEVAYAVAHGIFGSVDMNRGDPQNGWDTDQFPNNAEDLVLPLSHILRGGGFGAGGFNFDAKFRRQSIELLDMFHAFVGGIDTLALALRAADRVLEQGDLQDFIDTRYAGWSTSPWSEVFEGETSLAELADQVVERNLSPLAVTGRQEGLETVISRVLQDVIRTSV